MIRLYPGEKTIRIIHRHWIVIAGRMTVIVILLILPLLFFLFSSFLPENEFLTPFFLYLVSIYTLILTLIAFLMWVDYYLDVWIITDKRIIDIEQQGIFKREISEFMLDRVEDVTIEHKNFIEIMLKYGTIRIHTAGEQTFSAHDLPKVEEVKNIIIEEKMRSKQNENPKQP